MIDMKFPTKHAVIVFFLWAAAPIAWYIIWRDKKYHGWFPVILFVNGIVFTTLVIIQSLVYIPRLEAFAQINQQIELHYFGIVASMALVLFALIQIIYGRKLRREMKHDHTIIDRHLPVIIIILIIDVAIGFLTGILPKLLPYSLVV